VPWRFQVKAQLLEQGVDDEASSRMLAVMACRSLEELEQILGECDALNDLNQLLALAKGYGFDKWIECDASVVRGLAYYTGAALMPSILNAVWHACMSHTSSLRLLKWTCLCMHTFAEPFILVQERFLRRLIAKMSSERFAAEGGTTVCLEHSEVRMFQWWDSGLGMLLSWSYWQSRGWCQRRVTQWMMWWCAWMRT
jgi:hypothetical protein